MDNKNLDTEHKILEAANKVFVKNGFDGARMQQIADEAKINKSLLHYYYRSKDKLFAQVFKVLSKKFFPQIITIFSGENDFFEKIRVFASEYINILSKNPFLPNFILHEVTRNPDNISELFSNLINPHFDNEFKFIEKQLKQEFEKGRIIKIELVDFIVNLLSLCIFPFVGRPIIQSTFMNGSEELFNNFIEKRKTEAAEFFINSIKTK